MSGFREARQSHLSIHFVSGGVPKIGGTLFGGPFQGIPFEMWGIKGVRLFWEIPI